MVLHASNHPARIEIRKRLSGETDMNIAQPETRSEDEMNTFGQNLCDAKTRIEEAVREALSTIDDECMFRSANQGAERARLAKQISAEAFAKIIKARYSVLPSNIGAFADLGAE